MPANSLDGFAATNPAFCALILRSFAEGFVQGDPAGVPLPHVLLPLPVVLSADLSATFTGTNSTTGLLTWVGRSPEVTIDLRARVVASAPFSREALLFGLARRVLGVNEDGRIVPEHAGLRRRNLGFPRSEDRGRALAYARQFGRWVADVRSLETVFVCLGLNR